MQLVEKLAQDFFVFLYEIKVRRIFKHETSPTFD